MTRSRKQNGTGKGTVVFVGAGPGDPELLTVRAGAAIAGADTVLADPDVSAAVLEAVRAAHPDLELTTVSGEPAEVAKGAVAAAKNGNVVVRLVAGDPFTSDAVVKEALAVTRTSVAFDVVPGVAVGTAVPAYAGVPLGASSVQADLRAVDAPVDLAALAAAATGTGSPLVLQATAEQLPTTAAALVDGAQVGLHGTATERDAGVRGDRGADRHPGDDVEGDAGACDRERLLDHGVAGEGVAGDQPDHHAAVLGGRHGTLGDLGRLAADRGELEVRVGLAHGLDHGDGDVGVDQHRVGAADRGGGPGGEQLGVTGTGADEHHRSLAVAGLLA